MSLERCSYVSSSVTPTDVLLRPLLLEDKHTGALGGSSELGGTTVRGWLSIAAIPVAVLSGPSLARAQAVDAGAAESLFQAGKKLLEEKSYALACPKLAESYRLDPGTGTLLALALCHEGEGRLATAWGQFAEVAARSRREARPDREALARGHMSALGSRLPLLTIAVAPDTERLDHLEIRRDGIAVGPGSWATAVPVDPGHHHVEASAPGYRPFSLTLTLGAEADRQTVLVPVLEPDATAGPDGEAAGGKAGLSSWQYAGLAVGGAGVVGVIAGTVFGVRAIGLNNDSKGGCTPDCTAPALASRNDARTAGDISTVAFVAGGALLAGGAAMFLVGRPRSTGAAGLRAAPLVSGRDLGMGLEGAF